MLNKIPLIILLSFFSVSVFAASSSIPLEKARVEMKDTISLQRGAKLFVNYCLGCHSAKFMRYERMAEDLKIPKDIVVDNLMLADGKIGDQMNNAMHVDDAEQWFGTAPPDLSLEARLRGSDWLYTYLIGFYKDESRPWLVNNKVFSDVGMPHVLEGLEKELGQDQFKEAMMDLTNFMTYMAEPAQIKRKSLGIWVIAFLLVLLVPVCLLNKEYWKDIH